MRLQSLVVSLVLCAVGVGTASANVFTANPASHDFTSVSVTAAPVMITVDLNNDNGGGSQITGFSKTGASCTEFTPSAAGLPQTIGNNSTLTVTVAYDPVDRNADTCTIAPIFGTPTGSGGSFVVTGDGTAPQLMVTGGPLNFTAQRWNGGTPQILNVTVTNVGEDSFAMANLMTSLATGTQFSIGTITGTFPVTMGNAVTVPITFNPTSLGAKSDTLTVSLDNDSPGDANPTVIMNGTGTQSTQTFPAAPFDVGSSLVGSQISALLPIGNSGAAQLNFTLGSPTPAALDITGTNATDFVFLNHTCSGQLCNPSPSFINSMATDNYNIGCTPSGVGLRVATLTARSDDPAVSRTLVLNCTGLVPMISTSPAMNVVFPGVIEVGASASVQNLVISNAAGAAPLTYAIVSNSPTEFPLSCSGGGSACLGDTIAAGGSRTVQVGFVPQATLGRSTTLTISSDDPDAADNPKTINVSGTGGRPQFSATSPHDFGNVPVAQVSGVTSAIPIMNSGTTQLDISAMSITGDTTNFSFAFGTCTTGFTCSQAVTVSAGATSSTVTLRCDPTTSGPKTATLNVTSDSPGSPHQVMLTCNGTVPDVVIGGTPVAAFPDTRINTLSPTTRQFTVSNSNAANTAPLGYTVSESSTQFSIACSAPGCSGTLAAGAMITVTVSFLPTALGLQSTNIVVATPTDPDEASTNVAVSGTGVSPLIVLDAPTPVTPPTAGGALAFGNVNNGTTSTGQLITVRNNGTMDLLISNVVNTNTTDFDLTGPASLTLAPAATQSWTVTCDPETRGAKVGAIQIANNSENDTSVDVALSCTSIEGLLVVTASPVAVVSGTIDFGPVRLGNMRSTTVTLTNQGNVAVTVASVSLASMTEGFAVSGFTANTMVPPSNGTITFTVVFAPTLEAHGSTVLAVNSDWNDPNTNLAGDGQLADMVLSPNPANLGSVQWDASNTQVMNIQNLGSATINVISATLTSGVGEFTITGFTAGNLAGLGSRPFNLNAIPSDTMLGVRNGVVRLTTDLPPGMGQTIDVPVSYTSVGPGVTLSPGMVVDFGGVDVDGGPVTMQLSLTNSGDGRMDITSVGALTGVFGRTNFASMQIMPQQAQSLTVTYDPTAERDPSNPETQNFIIATDGLYANGTQQPANIQITVRGYGTDRHLLAPNVTFPPTYRNPTDTQVPTTTCGGTMDQACAVRVCNTGGALLDVSMIDDPADAFDLASTGPLMVTAGSAAAPTCMSVAVEFRPPSYGAFTGTVTIMNNDNAMPMAVVSLSGAGVARPVGVTPNLVDAATIAQGAAVRLTDLVPAGLVMVNMSSAEGFAAEVTAAPNSGLVTAELVGSDGDLAASQTRNFDVELIGQSPGLVDVVVEVHLDGDPDAHSSIIIPLEVVRVDVEGGGCDAGGSSGGAAGGAAAALGLLAFATRRRRQALARGVGAALVGLGIAGLVLGGGVARADVSRNIDVGSGPTTTATEPGLFDVDTPDVAAKGSWAFSLTGQYESNPMVARWTDSAMVEHDLALIEQRNTFVVGFGYAVTDRLELSARLPMFQQKGQARMEGDPFGIEGAEGFSLGDAAVRAKMQLAKGTVGFSGALDITAPTAKDGQFTGTDLPTAHLQGLLGVKSGRRLSLALNGGFLARQSTQFLLMEQGSDLTYGAAVALRVLDKVAIIGEGSGAMGVVGAEGKVSPLELTLGLRVRASRGATIGIGGGSGFGKAVGVADLRGFVTLVIAPGGSTIEPVRIIVPPPPRDTGDDDGDGIVNADDTCRGDAEDKDEYKDDDGCPEADNDEDGTLDGADQCPNEAEDKDGFTDEDGCNDMDNDADGVNDLDDKCPNIAEDKDGFNDNDGCDEPDNDNDGVPDVLDQCALEPETINGTDDEDGCPDKGDASVMLMTDRIEVLEPIQFVGTTAKLKPSATKVLSQVGATMRAERGVKRVRVTVHVHPRGGGDEALSEKRAEEIRKWLVQWGVEPERIDAKGIGSKRPLVAKGKKGAEEINDRVEFIILER